MRNVFVVLVSLSIGLASGFIVPTGGLEFMGEDRAILADNNGKDSEENKRSTVQDDHDNGFIVLPFRTNSKNKVDLKSNENRIREKELYDQHSKKQNNVNERSFIYINQKYKTPVLNQLYNSADLLQETYKPVIGNLDDGRYGQFIVSKKEYFEPNVMLKQSPKALYFPPIQYNQNAKSHKSMMITENNKEFNINQEGKEIEVKHEYVELLKPPLLRPLVKPESRQDNTIKWSMPEAPLDNYRILNRKPLKPNSHVDADKVALTHYDNYGFPTPYGYQRSIPKFTYIPDVLNEGTDNNIRNLVKENNNIDVSRLLDRYLKESLEEQVINDRINAKHNCSYSDCILKSRKQYIHSRVPITSECKCGRKLNMKRVRNEEKAGYETRDTTEPKEAFVSTEGYLSTRSSESNDYSDMLTEEMNLKKLIEE